MAAPPPLPLQPPPPGTPWRVVATDRRMAAVWIALAGLAAPLALALAGGDINRLLLVAAAGLAGWHFARIAGLPRVDPLAAALPMALMGAALLPIPAVAALILPVLAALLLARGRRLDRVVALMVQCGALLTLATAAGSGLALALTPAFLFVLSVICARSELSDAANDNPSMERVKHNPEDSKLPGSACYASADSIPGKWGVS